MTCNGKTVLFVAMLIACLAPFGCTSESVQATMNKSTKLPQVSGAWVGQIKLCKVYDAAGVEYDAAEFLVQSGPFPPGDLNRYDLVPLLCVQDGVSMRVMNPSKLPLGRTLEIQGKTIAQCPVDGPRQKRDFGGSNPVSRRPDSGTFDEFVLRVSAEPKVLD